MIDNINQEKRRQNRKKIEKRVRVTVDEDNYEYYPAQKQADFYDTEVHQRVAAYCRVSTDSDEQQFSFQLQKKYYEDYVSNHDNWELIKVYADEGISGTGREKRKEFNQMIDDCLAGKIDIVVTKSVSRFSRNIVDCISLVRQLQEMKRPVGVFFESECIFSLNDDSQMALSFIATMAEEESHIRSRSMESSLRMRLDNGIPLTPKLLGYSHDGDGNLIINHEEAPTVKLAFYMYLYGYSTQQIADAFIALGRKSYLGNIKWTSNSIIQILRNERHCGDVLTRKTYTPNYRTHLSKKNYGQRPQSRYFNHHEAIVSRDDFNAVQRMLDNAKYGNKSLLPELRVIDSGILKGFVSINPRWAGFKEKDYYMAAQSVYSGEGLGQSEEVSEDKTVEIHVEAGDFDLRGFEITRSEFFDSTHRPVVTFGDRQIILAFGSMLLTYLVAIPLGILLAVKQNTWFDDLYRVLALVASSIPAFWLGLLLMLLFSVKLNILPSNGFDTPLHWILPLLCSCFGTWAGSSRYIRSMVLDTIRQDYVRTARAKGTPENQVLFRHAFKNALLPLITSIGFSIGNFFGGSIVIEQVFGINGMGRMMLTALREKDIPTVMAGVIITAVMIAIGNLVADLLYGVVDPRIRAMYSAGGPKKTKKKEAAA